VKSLNPKFPPSKVILEEPAIIGAEHHELDRYP
jgi:hypothetical protein